LNSATSSSALPNVTPRFLGIPLELLDCEVALDAALVAVVALVLLLLLDDPHAVRVTDKAARHMAATTRTVLILSTSSSGTSGRGVRLNQRVESIANSRDFER